MSDVFTTDKKVIGWIWEIAKELRCLDPENELITLARTVLSLTKSQNEVKLRALFKQFKVDSLMQLEIEVLALLENEIDEIKSNQEAKPESIVTETAIATA